MKRKVKVAAESAGGVKPTAVLTNRPAPWSGNEMRRKVCGFRCSHSFAGNVCSFPCFYSVGLYCFFASLTIRSRPFNLCNAASIMHIRRYLIIRTRTEILKHALLVIPVSSSSFAFLSAVASDVLGLPSPGETAARRPLVVLSCTPPPPSASKFHATLCEPRNVPNNANAAISSDISVAFQHTVEKTSGEMSCQDALSLAARRSQHFQQPQLTSKWSKLHVVCNER